MSAYVLKAASKPRDYVLDWRSVYLQPMETIVDDLGWSIHSQEVGSKRTLRVAEQHHDFYRSWAEFRAGEPGRFYLVSSRVRTSRGRVLARSIVMRVASGTRPS